MWVAFYTGQFAGYVTLKWVSHYQSFKDQHIPEIMDLNVLPPYRNKGIGTQLLEVAEQLAATQSPIVGLGVGLYDDYGSAQKLYIKKGYIPDGHGVTYNYKAVIQETVHRWMMISVMVYKRYFMKELEKNIINLYGVKGKQWLTNLPLLIAQLKIDYGLSHLKPVNNLTYNYVLSGFQGVQPIVLKLGPDSNALKREALTLKAFSGFGSVDVFAEDDGMLLLERAVSGVSLKSYFPEKDNDAIQITCECLKRLHQTVIPTDRHFPHIKDWLIALDKNSSIPADYLHKARELRDKLIATSTIPVLLHGDLHHDNILQNGNDWVVIDPKGIIGEPAYEVAAFIRNPVPELLAHNNASSVIENRITQFAETLKISEHRIIDWCYVQAVLAWAWAIEDKGNQTYFKQLTEIFGRYL